MKCIIVDDEPIARKGIRSLVARIPELELMEMFNNASSAAIYLTSHPVDLVFLDVQMPGITGIEFARISRKYIDHLYNCIHGIRIGQLRGGCRGLSGKTH